MDVKPHFYLGSTGTPESYTSPARGGGSADIPERDRQEHSRVLFNQLEKVSTTQQQLKTEAFV